MLFPSELRWTDPEAPPRDYPQDRMLLLPQRTRSACSRYRRLRPSPIPLGSTVSNGVPAAGAGNLETIASRDLYRFSLTATTTLQSSHGSGVKSFLVRDLTTGATTSYSYSSRQLTLGAGDWGLAVGNYQSAGTYSFTLSRT